MRIGNLSACVPEGREHGSGHVSLEHGQTYTIQLRNLWHDRDCDAEVIIDGKSLGSFRINRHGTMTLERSPEDNGRFTFFKADSAEGQAAGAAEVSQAERGLIEVRFRPGFPIQHLRTVQPKQMWPSAPYMPMAPDPTWVPEWPRPTEPTWITTTTDPINGILRSASTGGGSVISTQSCTVSNSAQPQSSMEAGSTGLTGHSDQQFTDVAALIYDPAQEVVITLRLVRESVNRVRRLEPVKANPVPAPVA